MINKTVITISVTTIFILMFLAFEWNSDSRETGEIVGTVSSMMSPTGNNKFSIPEMAIINFGQRTVVAQINSGLKLSHNDIVQLHVKYAKAGGQDEYLVVKVLSHGE